MLRPAGLGALDIERFWWLLFAISTVVFVVVMGLIVLAIVRRRRPAAPEEADGDPAWGGRFLLIGGVVLPAIILSGAFIATLHEMRLLSAPAGDAKFTIVVTGHVWWWEARYPNGAVTANEIHIPTGETVRVLLPTADVIHSFWVPQLQTKTDMIPGRTNQTWLRTDTPGRYRGQCAQFCGLQHANMAFYVVADPPADFQSWLANQAAPAQPPGTALTQAGLAVFTTQTCAGCHAVRGTAAAGVVGPDLTHLASRQSIAAGTLQATGQQLASWIADPQAVKPGAEMPPTQLSPADLAALVAYLQSLQ
ncbi:MAG: cytochrome c oxidase subunit II [Actinomycetota bacterium]